MGIEPLSNYNKELPLGGPQLLSAGEPETWNHSETAPAAISTSPTGKTSLGTPAPTLVLRNLAALDIWRQYIEEEEAADNEAANGWWNQFKEALEVAFQGLGRTERDARTRGWANERALVGEVEKILKAGTARTIHAALYLIEKGFVSLPEKGAPQLRERARAYLGYDPHSDPGLISRLIRYSQETSPPSPQGKSLLEETFSNLEAKDSCVKTAFAIYSLVNELSPQAEIKQATQAHLQALQGHSSFKRAASKFFYSLSPTEVAVNVGLMFVSGGLGNLAKLLSLRKLEQVGVTGLKAMAGASATGFLAETVALGSFNNLHLALSHDPNQITAKPFADTYKTAASMIGFIKFFGNVGKLAAPSLAKGLGLTTEKGLTLGGKALTWGMGHSAGLGGMVASRRFNQALDWQAASLGGENEGLMNDLLGYVEFSAAQGMAHSTVNALTQGKLGAFQQRQQQEISELTTKLFLQTPARLSPAVAALSAGTAVFLLPELAQAMTHLDTVTPQSNGMALGNLLALAAGGLAMVAGRGKVKPERKGWAFSQVIAQLQMNGEKVRPQKAADLAHGFYIQGLTKAESPKQSTFRVMVSGKNKDPEIWRMLEAAGVIEARQQASMNPERKRWAFAQVIAQLQKDGEKVAPTRAAHLARKLYNQGIPEAERPSKSTFEAMVSGKRKDPEIWRMLKTTGVIEKHIKISVNPERKRWAFARAIARLQKEGKKVTPREAADLAHGIYIQGRLEKERPSRSTFRGMVSGKNKDPEIWPMLQAAGVVEARVKIKPERKHWAFAQVIEQLQQQEKKVTPTKAAKLARELYNQGIPEVERASLSTFEVMVSGERKDPEIWPMLEAAGVIEARELASVNPERKCRAFAQVIARLQKDGEKVTPTKAADLAREIYIQGLSPAERPGRSTFRTMVSGKNKDPEIWRMLQEGGVLAAQVKIDPERKRWAFSQVIDSLQEFGKKVSPMRAADLAHQIYIEGLPEAERPRQVTFRSMVSGKRKDTEILQRLRDAGVLWK